MDTWLLVCLQLLAIPLLDSAETHLHPIMLPPFLPPFGSLPSPLSLASVPVVSRDSTTVSWSPSQLLSSVPSLVTGSSTLPATAPQTAWNMPPPTSGFALSPALEPFPKKLAFIILSPSVAGLHASPSEWKISVLHQSSKRECLARCRIIVLSLVGKLQERIVHSSLLKFLLEHDALSPSQLVSGPGTLLRKH